MIKTFIDTTVKDFLKNDSGNILFGVQNASTFKLLDIYGAYESGSTDSVTSIVAVKINKEYPFNEISRTTLSNDLIVFDTGTNQYLIDQSKTLDIDEGLYYLEFKNGYNVFETEAFIVTISDHKIKWDMEIITWDSELITFDQTHINV